MTLRRLRLTALTALAALSLSGCSLLDEGGPRTASTDDKPLVLTSFTVIADMAREVAGDHVRVESITKPGAEVHGYEPTPHDIRNVAGAALLLENGFALEGWFDQFTAGIPRVVLSEGIDPILISVGDKAGAPNPHAWMSPTAGQVYVANIARAFGELVPEQAAEFTRRADAYSAQIGEIGAGLRERLAGIPEEHRFLATCEGAFSYLARDAGLDEGYLWAVNQENEGTPQQMADLIARVRERGVPTVFCESTVSDKAQREVAAATGARLAGPLFVDSLSDGPPVGSYLDLLRHDLDLIADGLGS
ncbi:metal ABC transporter substrate-binding protein [Mycetocola tolaasinivorans]|uniref:Metal ABC transporter substrate-binding protein n=1 Tax=Mycetocola tolaasinivorans TaxID=76635 RepID=A0A3L7A7M8_9MICO|nr:zinc ABC transporter substrate-binding protein [Mycetocola tolaasinivorans]RLP75352.1 metal ABC transporter substrate-binding protein [Mycetocola tolaasinivorans]